MNTGDFAKWTAQDEQGSFSYVGQIESINDRWINLQTTEGLLSFRPDDGALTPHEAINLTIVVKPIPDKIIKSIEPHTPKEVKVGSKLERAVAIVKANPNASRKELITMFVEQLSMTPAGASTYVYNAKKTYANS